jgi:hypothetical protein
MSKRMSKRTSVEPESNELSGDDRVAELERRLADVERKLHVVWSSRLGAQVRAIELGAKQREIERQREREAVAEREAAKPQRLRLFREFGKAKLAKHPDLETTVAALVRVYNEWASDRGIMPSSAMRMDSAELVDTVLATIDGAKRAKVHPDTYLGRPDYTEDGIDGVGLLPEGQTMRDVVEKFDSGRARIEAERRDRREWHEHEASVEAAVVETKRTRDQAAKLAVEAARK